MRSKKIQIMLIQEHNLNKEEQFNLSEASENKGLINITSFNETNPKNWGGSMIIIREDYFDDVEMLHRNIDGRLAIAKIKKNGKEMRIASIYAPANAEERPKYFESIKILLKSDTPIIIAGDFNCVTDVTLEVENENPLAYSNKGAESLEELINELQLIDERRIQLGEEK